MKQQADIITTFTDQIQGLHEVDYGDFKRKVSLYIRRLQQRLSPDQLRTVQDILVQMFNLVLYNPSAHIEATRTQVLTLAQTARERLRLPQ